MGETTTRFSSRISRKENGVNIGARAALGREPVTHDRTWVRFACQAHPGLTREQVLAKRLLDTVEEYRRLQTQAR